MNNELIIKNERALKLAVETLRLYDEQIKAMEGEAKQIRAKILEAMVAENLKTFQNDIVSFNRIMPAKRTLNTTEAQNWLIEKDLLADFQTLDENAVMKAFPQFVNETAGTEYVKITFKGEIS
jgi:hypothetical protein